MKKCSIAIGIIALMFIVGYLALSFYAVKFLRIKLQNVMGPGLNVAEIKIKPTCLYANGVEYKDSQSNRKIFKIEEMNIYPSISSLLDGSLRIRKWIIRRPSFFFSRSREGVLLGPWMSEEKEGKRKEISQEKREGELIHIRIDRIQVEKGSLDFEDMKFREPPANIQIKDLDLRIDDIQFPFISSHSPIQFKGKMNGKAKDGKIEIMGWIDIKTTDMAIFLDIQGIDVKFFEPYYQKRVSAEIESGTINMESRIAIKKRIIDAPGHLELFDLHIKEGDGTVLWIPAKTLVSLLKDKGNRIRAEFHVKGNLDNPHFNLQEKFFAQVAISLAEALGFPIKFVGEDITKDTGKGVEGLIEGVRSLEEIFKKRKEKKR